MGFIKIRDRLKELQVLLQMNTYCKPEDSNLMKHCMFTQCGLIKSMDVFCFVHMKSKNNC